VKTVINQQKKGGLHCNHFCLNGNISGYGVSIDKAIDGEGVSTENADW
jgi:hypothetical protein